jgi:hypothetical protein
LQRESAAISPVNTFAHRAHRITSWNPGTLGARPSSALRSALSARVSMRSAGGRGACGPEGPLPAGRRSRGAS